VLAEERRASRGAGHVHSLCVPPAERLGDLGASDHGAQPQLIAASKKDSVYLVQHVEPLPPLTIGAVGDGKHLGFSHPEIAEDFLVPASGVRQHRRRRYDGDPAGTSAAHLREPPEDGHIADLFLGSSNRNDVTPCGRHDVLSPVLWANCFRSPKIHTPVHLGTNRCLCVLSQT
jgi:hypothetical protein